MGAFQDPIGFYFYSFDCDEPRHVHVQRDNKTCKFWMDPLELASFSRFRADELRDIRRLIEANRILIMEAWDEHCGGR